ncbi:MULTISPECIES: MMPL family transporter [Streptomyces]|uniref:MMPL family transporter n=1 Tax=Streptomyces caniscabiei TaxID=2746961 RepID=A0ABU4MZT4_9ACTN|nr:MULTISPECIES: MMPL family transporter [Streptomyces]MBE4736719.1 MMPL family transporter [Streptomyces caniscabiei]MBE4759733.1 MMPL family transporter [Streptomyces caniscabiei]MBE4770643.1 MMPL family transporter [Streptomyces caniscabiei]MBE4786254.1 MMPL family transporter [Streptomyces caniscabiei]MBE4796385.1 MMPL family transporter [Streptomyces caniscabiei]
MTGNRGIGHLVCGRRAKWVVLGLWLVLLFVVAPFATKLTDAQDNDAASWLPGSAESTQVLEISEGFRPEQIPAVVVYARESGLTAEDRATIEADVRELRQLTAHKIIGDQTRGPVYDRAVDPRAAQVYVPITMDEKGWERIAPAVDSIRDDVGEGGDGLSVHITGPGGTSADFSEAFEGIDSTLLMSAMAVVIVMLLLTYRSPTLILVPLLAVIAALFTAQALIYLLAEHAGLTVNGQSAGILTVLVFGAGTDYALLLVARYREELRRHEDRHEAMALALHRAGPAVLASGATVVLSMLVLLAAEMNSTSGLGPVAAIGVAIALLAMMTLFPALLVIFGRWIFWPVIPHLGSADPTERGVWARMGRRFSRRPRTVWVATAAALALCSLGLIQLRAEGISNADAFTGKPDSIVGQEVSARYFPAGSGDPLVIISNQAQAREVGRAVADTEGVVADSLGLPPGTKPANDGKVLFEATMSDPADSEAAKDTVERVRDAVHAVPDADAQVGGGTAALLDMDEATTHDNILIIPLVLIVVLLILCALLRALIAPLLLIGTVILSFAAALGISALAFRHLFDYAGESTDFPLFVFVFLVALGIDYNIFLTTRIREEATHQGTRKAVVTGLATTGAVITSAGLVLAGTFAALGTLPMVAFAEIGFAVALGVLLDTFIVRSVLVTALFLDVGPKVWWPHRLAREDGGAAPPPKEPAATPPGG